MLGGDRIEHRLVKKAGDRLAERRGVGQGVVEQGSHVPARLQDILARKRGVDLLELIVVGRSQEGERRGQGAGTDAGDGLEHGPGPGGGPSDQQTCPKGAVLAAARNRQELGPGQVARIPRGTEQGLLTEERLHHRLAERRGIAIAPVAGLGQFQDDCLFLRRNRHRVRAGERSATRDDQTHDSYGEPKN